MPVAGRRAWLVPCDVRGAPRIRVPEEGTTLGRNGNCDIILKSDTISGQHFHIGLTCDGTWALEDLSVNGTVVNKALLGRGVAKTIEDGDIISIPTSRFDCLRVRFTLEPLPSSAATPLADRAELDGRVAATRQRILELRNEVQSTAREFEAERSDEADHASLLAQRDSLQKELQDLDLRNGLLATREAQSKAGVEDDLATLEAIYSELLEVRRRSALAQGGNNAKRKFLEEIREQHAAASRSLAAIRVQELALRGELQAARMEADAAGDEILAKRNAIRAVDASIHAVSRGLSDSDYQPDVMHITGTLLH